MNRRSLDLWIGIFLVVPIYFQIQGAHLALFRGGVASVGRESSEQILPLSFFAFPMAAYLSKGSSKLVPAWCSGLLTALGLWFGVLALSSSVESNSASLFLRMLQWIIPFVYLYYAAGLVAEPSRLMACVRGMVFGLVGTLLWICSSLAVENKFATLFTRMGDTAWGVGLYQPYNYIPLGVALALLLIAPALFTKSGYLLFPSLQSEPKRLALFLGLLSTMGLFTLASAVGDVAVVLTVGFSVFFIGFRRSFTPRHHVVVICLLVVGVLTILAIASQGLPLLEKVNYVLASEDKSRDRAWIFSRAIQLASDTPLVGTRFNRPDDLPSAHNYYLDAFLNAGLPAIGILVAFVFSFVADSIKVYGSQSFQRARSGGSLAFQLFLGSSVASLLMLLWSNVLNVPMRQPYSADIGWFTVGLALALGTRFVSIKSSG